MPRKPPLDPTIPKQRDTNGPAPDDAPTVTAQGDSSIGIGSIGGSGHTIHVTIIQSPPRIGPSVSDPASQPPASAPGSPAASTGQREVLRIELVSRADRRQSGVECPLPLLRLTTG